ncbi:MAG: molecular chaperone DnaJ [Xenococcaceae cyanobacterium MO_188.B32]|nr:molecular chaperone DnaJ [Xenococcaceae cyanobacterium MO_188.B32]
MNLNDLIAQIQSQLEELANQENINQQEQKATNQRIKTLERKIKEQYHRQSELDDEAIRLYRQGEELKTKLDKLNRITALTQEFRDLQTECQDNQELLHTLYSSISLLAKEESIDIDRQTIFNDDRQLIDDYPFEEQPTNSARQEANYQIHFEDLNAESPQDSTSDCTQNKQDDEDESTTLTLQYIKTVLPNAELIYKQLIARNLEKYQTYQNLIIDELDVIWCSVAFIAFGRGAYRQLSFKHHPDLNGSEEAMQLINTAWEISEEYLAETVNSDR